MFVFLFALAHFGLVLLGQAFHCSVDSVATVWFSAGFLLSVLLLTRKAQWPMFLAAAFVAEIGAAVVGRGDTLDFSGPRSTWLAFAGILHIGEAWLGALLIRRFSPRPVRMSRMRSVAAVCILCAFAATVVAAGMGTAALTVFGHTETPFRTWRVWWFADALGILAVTPLVVAVVNRMRRRPRIVSRRQVIELCAVVLATLLVGRLTFQVAVEPLRSLFAFPYLWFTVVVWGAIRFQALGVGVTSFVISAMLVAYTNVGRGPFATVGGGVFEDVFAMQVFLVSLIVSGLLLAALITERDILERTRTRAQTRLDTVSRFDDIGRNAAGVAHDLNNVMQAVSLHAAVVRDAEPGAESAQTSALQIELNIDRARRLARRLLEAPAMTVQGKIERVDVGRVITMCERLLRSGCPDDVAFELTVDPIPTPVLIDPVALDRILSNLVRNAVDTVAPRGRIEVGVKRNSEGDGIERVVLRVRDSNPGLDTSSTEKVFDPFFLTKGKEGVGLGLAVVRDLVTSSQGTVSVSGAAGGGTVEISWPVAS